MQPKRLRRKGLGFGGDEGGWQRNVNGSHLFPASMNCLFKPGGVQVSERFIATKATWGHKIHDRLSKEHSTDSYFGYLRYENEFRLGSTT